MESVCNYFGILIYKIDDSHYTAKVRGHEINGATPNEVKDNIITFERKEKKNDILKRLQDELGMNKRAANFVINMTAAHHSTEMAALMRIGDYLSAHGM